MGKINVAVDCANAPKMAFLKDFTSAFVTGDAQTILASLDDDVYWEMVGMEVIQGKTQAQDSLKSMLDDSMEELNIDNILTDGEAGCVNGTMQFKDGKTYGFCDYYTFTSDSVTAKIKTIHAYIVELKPKTSSNS